MVILAIGSILLFIARDVDTIVKVTLTMLTGAMSSGVVTVVLFGVCVRVLKAASVGLIVLRGRVSSRWRNKRVERSPCCAVTTPCQLRAIITRPVESVAGTKKGKCLEARARKG